MEIATDEETSRFINGLFYAWGQRLISDISNAYALNEEQKEVLETILLKPNNWFLEITMPLTGHT